MKTQLLAIASAVAVVTSALAFHSPDTASVSPLSGVARATIKAYAPATDGISWLHGVALCFHGDRLYASFGVNTGSENTCGECLHVRYSDDCGATWSASSVVANGSAVHGVSHGSLASVGGTLWAFAGSFSNNCTFVHTRAYRMSASGEWSEVGPVIGEGFWPMQNPIRLADGNWIMGGLRAEAGWNVTGGNRPAVAISEGDDLSKWRLIVPEGNLPGDAWGEATVDLKNGVLTLTCRPGWSESPMVAHTATSTDNGSTWTALTATEMKVVTAKPFTGTLSDGRRYVISTITSDGGARRSPLMIAWGEADETDYAYAASIATCSASTTLSYPSAVEHDGKLYIGYSNDGGRAGNRNSAELAIVSLKSLDDYQKTAEHPSSVAIGASDDAMVYDALPDNNYGKYERTLVGVNTANGQFGRTLLRFSDFNRDAQRIIDGAFYAVLRVYMFRIAKVSYTQDRVPLRLFLLADDDCDWKEGDTFDAVASTGECCWNWLAKDQQAWSSAGLSPDHLVEIASIEVGPVSSISDGTAIDIPITSSAGLKAIRKWIAGGKNAGFLLAGQETPTSDGLRAIDIYSKDTKKGALQPQLILKNPIGAIACSEDSFFYSDANYSFADRDWGADTVLCVGRNAATAVYRGILRFDLADKIFQDAFVGKIIDGAKVTLTVANVAKKGIGAYKLRLHLLADANSAWKEGIHDSSAAVGTTASPGAGCWNYCAYNTQTWVGGAGIGIDSTSAGIDVTAAEVEINASTLAIGSKIVFDIHEKSTLRRIGQWIEGGDNAGFYLTTDEAGSSQAAVQVAAREHPTYEGPMLKLFVTNDPTTNFYVNASNEHPALPYGSPETAATTIQAAYSHVTNIMAAGIIAAAEIRVAPGTYPETDFVLDMPIAIVGESGNPEDVEIVDQVSGKRGFTLTHEKAVVRGLTISGTGYNSSSEAEARGGHVHMTAGRVSRCLIKNGKALNSTDSNFGYGGGIYAVGGIIENCLLVGNGSGDNVSGNGIWASGTARIVNCTVVDNANNNIYLDGAGVEVVNSVFFGCGEHDIAGTKTCYSHCAASIDNDQCDSWRIIDETAFWSYARCKQAIKFLRPSSGSILVSGGTKWDGYQTTGGTSEHDILGKPRLRGARLDIGAFEGATPGIVIRVKGRP